MTSQQAEQIQGKNEMHDASAVTIILQNPIWIRMFTICNSFVISYML